MYVYVLLRTVRDPVFVLKASAEFAGTSKHLMRAFHGVHEPHVATLQEFSYLSEVGDRGLLILGKKHLDHQNWENLMQSKRTGLLF